MFRLAAVDSFLGFDIHSRVVKKKQKLELIALHLTSEENKEIATIVYNCNKAQCWIQLLTD